MVIKLAEVYYRIPFTHILANLDTSILAVERYLAEQNAQAATRQRLEYFIQRQAAGRRFVTRLRGKHGSSLLFKRETCLDLDLLILPEEQTCPVRHMYDPRYFNSIKTIGSGAFGSISQVEHRITGKMMALKTLVRGGENASFIDWEIRAMLRVQGSSYYPTLLGTYMDNENFYLLMVRTFLRLRLRNSYKTM